VIRKREEMKGFPVYRQCLHVSHISNALLFLLLESSRQWSMSREALVCGACPHICKEERPSNCLSPFSRGAMPRLLFSPCTCSATVRPQTNLFQRESPSGVHTLALGFYKEEEANMAEVCRYIFLFLLFLCLRRP